MENSWTAINAQCRGIDRLRTLQVDSQSCMPVGRICGDTPDWQKGLQSRMANPLPRQTARTLQSSVEELSSKPGRPARHAAIVRSIESAEETHSRRLQNEGRPPKCLDCKTVTFGLSVLSEQAVQSIEGSTSSTYSPSPQPRRNPRRGIVANIRSKREWTVATQRIEALDCGQRCRRYCWETTTVQATELMRDENNKYFVRNFANGDEERHYCKHVSEIYVKEGHGRVVDLFWEDTIVPMHASETATQVDDAMFPEYVEALGGDRVGGEPTTSRSRPRSPLEVDRRLRFRPLDEDYDYGLVDLLIAELDAFREEALSKQRRPMIQVLPELLKMPRQRPVMFKSQAISQNLWWRGTRPSTAAATVAQAVGDVAPNPCFCCSEGRGLFRECVIVRWPVRDASGQTPIFNGACANCYEKDRASDCQYRFSEAQLDEIKQNRRTVRKRPARRSVSSATRRSKSMRVQSSNEDRLSPTGSTNVLSRAASQPMSPSLSASFEYERKPSPIQHRDRSEQHPAMASRSSSTSRLAIEIIDDSPVKIRYPSEDMAMSSYGLATPPASSPQVKIKMSPEHKPRSVTGSMRLVTKGQRFDGGDLTDEHLDCILFNCMPAHRQILEQVYRSQSDSEHPSSMLDFFRDSIQGRVTLHAVIDVACPPLDTVVIDLRDED